jgi:hypothetical protein
LFERERERERYEKYEEWKEEEKRERNKKGEFLSLRERNNFPGKIEESERKLKGEKENRGRWPRFYGQDKWDWKFGAKISLIWASTALIPAFGFWYVDLRIYPL